MRWLRRSTELVQIVGIPQQESHDGLQDIRLAQQPILVTTQEIRRLDFAEARDIKRIVVTPEIVEGSAMWQVRKRFAIRMK
jgi:hypothetical protein